jgi:rhamnogalacturonyl hydrolase YesR
MNYKKLFWGYMAFSATVGFAIGIIRGIEQEKIKRRLRNNPLLASKAFQEIYTHYNEKEADFPEWVNTDEEAKFTNIVARMNHPTYRQK